MSIAKVRLVLGAFVAGQRGASTDVRELALCIDELARAQLEFAQLVHDGVCRAAPELGVKITDWIETEEEIGE